MPITIPAPRPATASRPQTVAPPAVGASTTNAVTTLRSGRPRGNDLLFFTARLALLLDTGTSLNRALMSLAAQQRDPLMQQLTQRILADVEEGSALSAALGRHPNAFDPAVVGRVRAGESAGILPAMLSRQADLLHRNRQFRAQLRSSLAYPCFLVVLSVIVSFFLLFVIYPRFASVFDNVEAALPPVTRVLL